MPLPIIDVAISVSVNRAPWCLGVCRSCGSSHRIVDGDEAARIDDTFRSDDYINRRQVPQTVRTAAWVEPVPRHVLQAEILAAQLDSGMRLLDIGCSDGALLARLAQRTRNVELVGYDVGLYPPRDFPSGPGISWVGGARDDIPGQFDAIILSYSLQYIRDLSGLGQFFRDRVR
ncbi:MAG: class I SAM-dependent methyltransferase, partial [Magnetospirillum sp.]|nr:class I SAM-dependent methyltransferase [Magnetospirillum sp.]